MVLRGVEIYLTVLTTFLKSGIRRCVQRPFIEKLKLLALATVNVFAIFYLMLSCG